MKMKFLAGMVILLAVMSCSPKISKNIETAPKAKYVFLFIGDGMGLAHTALTEAYLSAVDKQIGLHRLQITGMPVAGLCRTYCADSYITCSAASGTAIASGEKTNFGNIGLRPDGSNSNSLAADCAAAGMKTGIITTVSIDHATPADFYAHSGKRSDYYEIGKQLTESNIDFFAGGGFKYPKGRKGDQPDLYDMAAQHGYRVVRDSVDTRNFKTDGKTILINPVLMNDAEMPFAMDRDEMGGYNMTNLIEAAISQLYGPEGFFIMAEGGLIDWAAHYNDASGVVTEVLDLDAAVGVALDFYRKYPDETLIIVTADHETGGMSLGYSPYEYTLKPQNLALQKASAWYIELKIRKIMADGASFEKVLELLRTDFFNEEFEISDTDLKLLKAAYDYANKTITLSDTDEKILYGGNHPVAAAAAGIVSRNAAVGFTSYYHSGIPVPVFSIGVGSNLFEGYIDNTDISKFIKRAAGIENNNSLK